MENKNKKRKIRRHDKGHKRIILAEYFKDLSPMKRLFSFITVICLSSILSLSQDIKSPGEFLGFEAGTRFTFHHEAVAYFKYISEVSPAALLIEYGKSYEGRPLIVCLVSAEENLKNLDEFRKNNLIKSGFEEGKFTGRQVPFIWLGYNIHGNEAAGMEAAMKTLYTLVAGTYEGSGDWLRSCIIIIDPCQNPDGRELYASRYRTSQSSFPDPDRNAWEHTQGWPGARSNHYFFDLNRDWAWQTQAETQQRIALYNSFMPHLFADFHEMGAETTFFFAPGADPWHEVITPWQHEFHELMGRANATLFDRESRLYFTKENFDLFCPSFGDTWPLFNGSIGFTFEQGGGGVSGLAYKKETGDTLTLRERIDGHFTATIATLKVSHENREKLISEFNRYFEENRRKPSFKYKSVIIKGSNDKAILENLKELLARNQIRYSQAGSVGKKFKGFSYGANSGGETVIEKGDLLISAYQPQSRLMQVLFEPDSKASDSLTYDLSAWAIPYAFNLKAYAIEDQIKPSAEEPAPEKVWNEYKNTEKPYAYIVNFTGFNELRLIAALHGKGIRPRHSLKSFSSGGMDFNSGSVIITRSDNKLPENRFDQIVTEEADKLKIRLVPVTTGLVDKGKDLGSAYTPMMKKNSIALLCGEGTSAGPVGELWYFFERELNYPVTLITTATAGRADLRDYDILILASGSYAGLKDTIIDFAKRGGKVIALENAISVFAGDKSTALFRATENRSAELKAAEKKIRSDDTLLLRRFEDERRHPLSERSAGSIYRVKLDETHPYTFGLGSEWFVMKRSSTFHPFLDKGRNIGYITEKEPVAGFAGYKYKEKISNTLVIGSETIGSGEVVYITDNPYFRAFWKSGRVLLGNVVLR